MTTRPVYGVMDFLAGFRLPGAPSAAPDDGEMYAAGGKVYLRYSGAWVEVGAGAGGGGTVITDQVAVDASAPLEGSPPTTETVSTTPMTVTTTPTVVLT